MEPTTKAAKKPVTTVVNYETFESSSGEEMAHGMFESEALSF